MGKMPVFTLYPREEEFGVEVTVEGKLLGQFSHELDPLGVVRLEWPDLRAFCHGYPVGEIVGEGVLEICFGYSDCGRSATVCSLGIEALLDNGRPLDATGCRLEEDQPLRVSVGSIDIEFELGTHNVDWNVVS